jgi:hypothetical protein
MPKEVEPDAKTVAKVACPPRRLQPSTPDASRVHELANPDGAPDRVGSELIRAQLPARAPVSGSQSMSL